MNRGERELAERRAARDRARGLFEQRLGLAKSNLAPTSVKARMVADVRYKSLELASEAIEIANDSRGVVIGTAAALALWLARKPIGKAVAGLWRHSGAAEAAGVRLDRIREILGAGLVRTTTKETDRDD